MISLMASSRPPLELRSALNKAALMQGFCFVVLQSSPVANISPGKLMSDAALERSRCICLRGEGSPPHVQTAWSPTGGPHTVSEAGGKDEG